MTRPRWWQWRKRRAWRMLAEDQVMALWLNSMYAQVQGPPLLDTYRPPWER